MLRPDDRKLYTEALRPPPGHRFESAVAATYSLDLETLLTIPLHLALFSAERPLDELLRDGVALLEALRRTTDRVTVYAQGGRMLAPAQPHVLYGLLEKTVVEVMPPDEMGSFHPKLWLIRFDNPDDGSTVMRLLILSRNITGDRCWDLALTLDGVPGRRNRAANRPLHDMVTKLPDLALRQVDPSRREQAESLADLARRSVWELPENFDEVRFHALGLSHGRAWNPVDSKRLAVISPFLSNAALEQLIETTNTAAVLVSRPEELAAVDPEILRKFDRVMMLAEQAELEDGEEPQRRMEPALPTYGLHAKAYIAQAGWYTHLYVGSANASNPALVHGSNVELMAELIGKASRGRIDDLLDPEGFGAVLTDYNPDEAPDPPDPEVDRALLILDDARRDLVASGIRIRFTKNEDGWVPTLEPSRAANLTGITSIRAWLVARRPETATDAAALGHGEPVTMEPALVQHLTSFVAFELVAERVDEPVRFVLGLEAIGLPVAERDAAVVRDVIRNRDGFLRYVMLLLAEAGEDDGAFGKGAAKWDASTWAPRLNEDLPLFESLTRTFCRQPERLASIERLLNDLQVPGEDDVVPPGFVELWTVFRAAVDAGTGVKA